MTTTLTMLGQLAAANDNPAADFSDTPIWLSLVKAILLFVYVMLSVVVVIWFERRVVAIMQNRTGPNRFGPFGLLQTLADGFKLMWKEVIIPKNADRFVYLLAPIIMASTACITFAVIPLSGTVSMFGHQTPLQVTDSPVAVILGLAAAGLGAYGAVLGGWASGSTYPLLGGLRAAAQIISYEIAMGLSLVAVFLNAGSMSTSAVVEAQRSMWFIIPVCVSFVIYLITMVGETNRIPFDLAEGEGEIVAGHMTEYSGMRFGMFFLGEYINMFTVSALAATMFLGGWQAPPGIAAIGDGYFNGGWWGLLWFTIKMWLFMWFFVWLRGTLPRTRYDQFMAFGWKRLIPLALVWVMFVAFVRAARNGYLGANTTLALGIIFAVTILVVFAVAWVWDVQRERQLVTAPVPTEIDPFAGGYPVPPLPGQHLREPTVAAAPLSAPVNASTASTPTEEAGRG